MRGASGRRSDGRGFVMWGRRREGRGGDRRHGYCIRYLLYRGFVRAAVIARSLRRISRGLYIGRER